ncbi:VOC family protein [Candidatus Woesearchaeota archaeon]|nr:VOC family protein [Candidatus Woesearchaeota archaeon]
MSNVLLSSVVLRSRDLEEMRQFYEQLLGMPFQEEQHERGRKHYSCRLGDVLLELYPRRTDDAGTDQLGFTVDSLDRILECIEEKYVRHGPFDTMYGRGLLLRDPEGRLIHLEEKNR